MQDGSVTRQHFHVAAIVKIVDAEGAFTAGFDREVAPRDAEVIAIRGIHVEGSRALAKNQARGPRTIVERKVEKLNNGVLVEESHRAILKFDFGAAIVRGKNVALADGKIRLRRFPNRLLIRERVSMSFSRKAHITLDNTQANDAGVARIGDRRLDAGRESEGESEGKDRTKCVAGSHVSPPHRGRC